MFIWIPVPNDKRQQEQESGQDTQSNMHTWTQPWSSV